MIKKATEYSVVHEGQLLRSVPTPQLKLATIDDVRREMAKVYREARTGMTDTANSSRLVYMLTSIAKMIEIGQLEQRITILEENNNERT